MLKLFSVFVVILYYEKQNKQPKLIGVWVKWRYPKAIFLPQNGFGEHQWFFVVVKVVIFQNIELSSLILSEKIIIWIRAGVYSLG